MAGRVSLEERFEDLHWRPAKGSVDDILLCAIVRFPRGAKTQQLRAVVSEALGHDVAYSRVYSRLRSLADAELLFWDKWENKENGGLYGQMLWRPLYFDTPPSLDVEAVERWLTS